MRLPFNPSILEQHIAILGKTGSGKSSVMRVLMEWLLEGKHPVTLLDVKGDWWGLKSSADGKHAGFPVVIFGGLHGDVPLNEHAGASIAELVASSNRPSIIDLSQMMAGERTRFFIRFAEAFFRHTQSIRWLFIDEVHNYAPKGKIFDVDAGKMLHWANRFAAEGRGKGINLVVASQRPQKVHNDLLDSCETLIAMRSVHPRARGAIKEWIDGCADLEQGKQVLNGLASMPRGSGWVWSPEIGFGPAKIAFEMFTTYDSFKPQAARVGQLSGWADVNLDEVKSKLSGLVEEAKANDPKLLHKRIDELEAQIASGAGRDEYERGVQDGHAKGWQAGRDEGMGIGLASAQHAILEALPSMEKVIADLRQIAIEKRPKTAQLHGRDAEVMKLDLLATMPIGTRPRAPIGDGISLMDRMTRAFLTALAQHPKGLTKKQVLLFADYARSGDTGVCFARLQRGGLVTTGDVIKITPAGLEALGDFEPLPTGAKLRQHLVNSSGLKVMERKFLEVLFEEYPNNVAKSKILERAGYARSGDTGVTFGRMLTRGYAVQGGTGELRAAPELFA